MIVGPGVRDVEECNRVERYEDAVLVLPLCRRFVPWVVAWVMLLLMLAADLSGRV